MNIRLYCIAVLSLLSLTLHSQKNQYQISLQPVEIAGFAGLQSFAFAQQGDYLLILGGRLDGLHRRQPWATFDQDGNNNRAIVLDLKGEQSWSATFEDLPASIAEQLSSTNMQFYQQDDRLILTGGYAYSATEGDHITFPYLIAVDVPALIEQVQQGSITATPFMQVRDEQAAVTGGRLEIIGDTYYLVGGHRFDGRYNPMGPTHGPGFEQEYTDEVRRFRVSIDNGQLQVEHLQPFHDERHLHRRDYNLLPQIRGGEEELMLFSGVFQATVDLPWLYPVRIHEGGYEAIEDFSQLYNHYHCATLPVYNAADHEMHNLFFGGIAQFYDDDGVLVQDNDVPFVTSIADVVVDGDGAMHEQLLTTTMPALLGAGAEFIVSSDVLVYDNGVLQGDALDMDPVTVGYIVGGIRSDERNIFFINDGTQSEAVRTLYKVVLQRQVLTSITRPEIDFDNSLLIYPNPAQDIVRMAIDLDQPEQISVEVKDSTGRLIGRQSIPAESVVAGRNYLVLDQIKPSFGKYLYVVRVGDQISTRWVHWSE